MQDTTITGDPASASSPRRRRWPWITATLAVLAAIAVVIGTLAGSASSARSQVARDKAAIASLRGQVSSLNGQVSSLNGQVSAARQQAQGAQAAAEAKAGQDYASRNAALKQQAADLKSQQAAVAAEAGRLDASKISDDGVYVAGQDIQAGTWHTPGDGGQGGDNCYFAVLNSTDTSDIADNNNFDGPETVTVPAGKSFEISGGCPWYRTS